MAVAIAVAFWIGFAFKRTHKYADTEPNAGADADAERNACTVAYKFNNFRPGADSGDTDAAGESAATRTSIFPERKRLGQLRERTYAHIFEQC